jgi:hypothetical protein
MLRRYWILILYLVIASSTVFAADSASLFKAVNSNNVKEVRAILTDSPDLSH